MNRIANAEYLWCNAVKLAKWIQIATAETLKCWEWHDFPWTTLHTEWDMGVFMFSDPIVSAALKLWSVTEKNYPIFLLFSAFENTSNPFSSFSVLSQMHILFRSARTSCFEYLDQLCGLINHPRTYQTLYILTPDHPGYLIIVRPVWYFF